MCMIDESAFCATTVALPNRIMSLTKSNSFFMKLNAILSFFYELDLLETQDRRQNTEHTRQDTQSIISLPVIVKIHIVM